MQTILVVDDDELVSRTLQRALKLYDYQVMVAHSGTEGLHLARRHRPDLLLLDIVMQLPQMWRMRREINNQMHIVVVGSLRGRL